MLTIDSINMKDVLELKKYRQPPEKSYTRITLIRGNDFYARLINDQLQEWCGAGASEKIIAKRFAEFTVFEEKIGSKLLQ